MTCKLNKKLTVLIINFNTSDCLKNCIQSIYKSSPESRFDVLIVDNNSADKSIENISSLFPHIHIIKNITNLGFGTANNIAIRKISSKYILLLNSDTVILPKSIDSMIQAMDSHPSTGILGCQLLTPDGEYQESYSRFPGVLNEFIRKGFQFVMKKKYPLFRKGAHRKYGKLREVDWVSGACMLVRNCAMNDSGLFDENYFMYFEDVDICLRMKRSGWKVRHTPEANVIHFGGASARQNVERIRREYRKSHLYYYSKYNNSFSNNILRSYMLLKDLLTLAREKKVQWHLNKSSLKKDKFRAPQNMYKRS